MTDPGRFDVGNVDLHSLLLGSAERADVIVDFSQYRRQDADPLQRRAGRVPGARPAVRLYTGNADQRDVGGAALDPAWLRAEHPDDHAGEDCRGARARPRSTSPPLQAAFAHRLDGPAACSNRRSTRSSSVRRRTTRPTGRPSRRPAGATPRAARPPLRRVRPHLRAGRRPLRLQHAVEPDDEDGDSAAAEGDARRAEFVGVRRVRADAGDDRRRSAGRHAAAPEHRPLPVPEPADRADRRHEPAEGPVEVQPISVGDRRHPDLEDHAQRGGHAPDPLPPLRRAAAEPLAVGRPDHPSARPERTGMEGHGADCPARGHVRRAAAGRPEACRSTCRTASG